MTYYEDCFCALSISPMALPERSSQKYVLLYSKDHEMIIFFSSLMDNNPINACLEKISSFKNSIKLLTSE